MIRQGTTISLFLFMMVTVYVSAVRAEYITMSKTGQMTCYTEGGTIIDCKNTGQDGEHQIGMAWPNPRFIDRSDGTVLDRLTSLMWTKNAQQIKGTMKWGHALAACNNLNFAGYTDWRLPNAKELLSLIDYEQHDPALCAGHPFDKVQFLFYWTSTTYDAIPSHAWGVYICNGYAFNYHKVTDGYVWPVRCSQ